MGEAIELIPNILLPVALYFISLSNLGKNSSIVFPEFSTRGSYMGNNEGNTMLG